jgi:hypothetical protein
MLKFLEILSIEGNAKLLMKAINYPISLSTIHNITSVLGGLEG